LSSAAVPECAIWPWTMISRDRRSLTPWVNSARHQDGQAELVLELADFLDHAVDDNRCEANRRLVDQQDFGCAIRARQTSICCSPPLIEPASCYSAPQSLEPFRSNIPYCGDRRPRLAPIGAEQQFSSDAQLGESWRPSGTMAMPRSTIASGGMPFKSHLTPSILDHDRAAGRLHHAHDRL